MADLQSRWGEVQRKLLTGGLPLLAAALAESSAVAWTGDLLTLAAPARRQALLLDPEQQRLLAGAVASVVGARPKIVLRTAGGVAQADPVADERKRRYTTAASHPLVQDIVKRFQAELVGQEIIDLETWLARLAGPGQTRGRDGDEVVDG